MYNLEMDLCLNTFLGPSGISYVGQAYFDCFTKLGIRVIPIWFYPPQNIEYLDPEIAPKMMSAAARPIVGPAIQFHAGRSDDVRFLKSRIATTGSIVLEGNRLIEEQLKVCREMDIVTNPSYFCRNACRSSGIPSKRLFYLPYPLNTEKWNPSVTGLPRDRTRFRFLYMNSWYERKGWDVLLRAYWEEFSANDPVELVIKSYQELRRTKPVEIFLSEEANKLGVDRTKRAPISVADAVMKATEIPVFMKSFDAYVSPHRSEGFGLNIWHAMALGVPVICTDYGGNTDFTKPNTAWLVKVSEMNSPSEIEIDIFPHLRGINWAEPDVLDLRRQMRNCMMNPIEAQKRALNGSDLVATSYSYDRVSLLIEELFSKNFPKIWDGMLRDRNMEIIATQKSERFKSSAEPLKMIEI
jgi:glycosyltransferase involved in cell wall biosynthesis